MEFRPATRADAEAIAALHAASWRSAYRDALSDEYLAGEIVAERTAVWSERLGHPAPTQHVVVAEDEGRLAGFGSTFVRDHPEWGSLLDNLHVAQALQGQGVGTLLLRNVAAWCAAEAPESPFYLWVLKINVRAQNFYQRLGAVNVGQDVWTSPDGGAIPCYRFAWQRPGLLIAEKG